MVDPIIYTSQVRQALISGKEEAAQELKLLQGRKVAIVCTEEESAAVKAYIKAQESLRLEPGDQAPTLNKEANPLSQPHFSESGTKALLSALNQGSSEEVLDKEQSITSKQFIHFYREQVSSLSTEDKKREYLNDLLNKDPEMASAVIADILLEDTEKWLPLLLSLDWTVDELLALTDQVGLENPKLPITFLLSLPPSKEFENICVLNTLASDPKGKYNQQIINDIRGSKVSERGQAKVLGKLLYRSPVEYIPQILKQAESLPLEDPTLNDFFIAAVAASEIEDAIEGIEAYIKEKKEQGAESPVLSAPQSKLVIAIFRNVNNEEIVLDPSEYVELWPSLFEEMTFPTMEEKIEVLQLISGFSKDLSYVDGLKMPDRESYLEGVYTLFFSGSSVMEDFSFIQPEAVGKIKHFLKKSGLSEAEKNSLIKRYLQEINQSCSMTHLLSYSPHGNLIDMLKRKKRELIIPFLTESTFEAKDMESALELCLSGDLNKQENFALLSKLMTYPWFNLSQLIKSRMGYSFPRLSKEDVDNLLNQDNLKLYMQKDNGVELSFLLRFQPYTSSSVQSSEEVAEVGKTEDLIEKAFLVGSLSEGGTVEELAKIRNPLVIKMAMLNRLIKLSTEHKENFKKSLQEILDGRGREWQEIEQQASELLGEEEWARFKSELLPLSPKFLLEKAGEIIFVSENQSLDGEAYQLLKKEVMPAVHKLWSKEQANFLVRFTAMQLASSPSYLEHYQLWSHKASGKGKLPLPTIPLVPMLAKLGMEAYQEDPKGTDTVRESLVGKLEKTKDLFKGGQHHLRADFLSLSEEICNTHALSSLEQLQLMDALLPSASSKGKERANQLRSNIRLCKAILSSRGGVEGLAEIVKEKGPILEKINRWIQSQWDEREFLGIGELSPEQEANYRYYFFDHPMADSFKTYVRVHKNADTYNVKKNLPILARALIEGNCKEVRYKLEGDEHLTKIATKYPEVWEGWKADPQPQKFSDIIGSGGASNQESFCAFIEQQFKQVPSLGETFPHLQKTLEGGKTSELDKASPLEKALIKFYEEGGDSLLEIGSLVEESKEVPLVFSLAMDFFISNLEQPSVQSSSFTVVDTDDPIDIFNCGVGDSCQRIDGKPTTNQYVLGYCLDGKNRMVAVKDENGNLVARHILRLAWDEESKQPALYLEPLYSTVSKKEFPVPCESLLLWQAAQTACKLGIPLYRGLEKGGTSADLTSLTFYSSKGIEGYDDTIAEQGRVRVGRGHLLT